DPGRPNVTAGGGGLEPRRRVARGARAVAVCAGATSGDNDEVRASRRERHTADVAVERAGEASRRIGRGLEVRVAGRGARTEVDQRELVMAVGVAGDAREVSDRDEVSPGGVDIHVLDADG